MVVVKLSNVDLPVDAVVGWAVDRRNRQVATVVETAEVSRRHVFGIKCARNRSLRLFCLGLSQQDRGLSAIAESALRVKTALFDGAEGGLALLMGGNGLLVDGGLLVAASHCLIHPCFVLDGTGESRIEELRGLGGWALHGGGPVLEARHSAIHVRVSAFHLLRLFRHFSGFFAGARRYHSLLESFRNHFTREVAENALLRRRQKSVLVETPHLTSTLLLASLGHNGS